MPRISAFYGIVISMYFDDHAPPHFHADYGEHSARFEIATLKPMDADLPSRALNLIREWGLQHREELMANWDRARLGESLSKIDPLP